MTASQFFQAIKPGITLYGVLLTFSLIGFGLGRFFWKYNKDLIDENIERVKALMDGHRHRHVEPILIAQLSSAIKGVSRPDLG